ncbi:MAG: tetratricopeptide repeat protein [Armatimonadota bacterium]
MIRCPKCQAEFTDNLAACPQCGAASTPQQPSEADSLQAALAELKQLTRLKQYDLALSRAHDAIRRFPDQPALEAGIVFIEVKQLSEQRRFADAIAHCENALQRFPEYVMFYAELGDLYTAVNQLDNAFATYNRALTLDPSSRRLQEKCKEAARMIATAGERAQNPVEEGEPRLRFLTEDGEEERIRFPSYEAERGSRAEQVEGFDGPVWLAMLRASLTPRRAKWVVTAAIVIIFISTIMAIKPWVHPRQPAGDVAPITEVVRTPPVTTTPAPSSTTTPGKRGKMRHHVKPKGSANTPADTMQGTAVPK